jgi:hypothetical protein
MKSRRRIAAPKPQGCADYALEWRNYSRDLQAAKWGFRGQFAQHHPEPLMSALGHKRTLKSFRPMSALPPKADIQAIVRYD